MAKSINEFKKIIDKIFEDDIKKIVISDSKCIVKKINLEKKTDRYLASKYTKTQVFNENITFDKIKTYILSFFDDFKQYNLWSINRHYFIRISKKGKFFYNSKKDDLCSEFKEISSNDRQKNYLLLEGNIIPAMIEMGIMTQEGKIISSKYNKFRQVNHFISIIDDTIKNLQIQELNILDFGCGKSYLTFVLYYYLTEIKHIKANIVGLDLKQEVIENCNKLAKQYNYNNLKFQVGDIFNYKTDKKIDMIVTLHACDVATDFALYNAIKWNVKYIFSVPCCQHEINKQIKSKNFNIINRYGIAKERISAIFTDIIRCNLLAVNQYDVKFIDFVDFSDTPKNLMIRAIKTNVPINIREKKLKEVELLMQEFNFNQKLYQLLYQYTPKLNKEGKELHFNH